MEVREVTITSMASSDRLPHQDKIPGGSSIDWIDNTAVERDNGVNERDVKVTYSPLWHCVRVLTSCQFLLLWPLETTDTDDYK